jgi:hypothetical protein
VCPRISSALSQRTREGQGIRFCVWRKHEPAPCPGNNIKDELTGGATLTDATVGMYVVGEPISGGTNTIGYSRFTTSPSSTSASWFVGSTPPGGGSCNAGSLYSCASASVCSTTYTLYDCEGGSWLAIK